MMGNRYVPTEADLLEIEIWIKNDPALQGIRKQIAKALASNPTSVTYEQAKAQVDAFRKASSEAMKKLKAERGKL